MLHVYRAWNLRTRLLILGLLLLIGASVGFAYHQNLPLILGIIAALGVAVDVVSRRPRLTLSVVITLLQLALLTYLAFFASTLLSTVKESSADFLLDLLIAVYGLIALLILQIFISVYVLNGRIWFNLLVFDVITDLSFLYFAGLTQYVIYGLLIALGFTAAYAAIRFPYRHIKFEARLELRLAKNTERRVGDMFKNKHFQIKKTEGYNLLSYVAFPDNASRLYALCVIDDHMRLALKKNRVLINDADFTPGLEVFLSEIRKFAKAYKVPQVDIIPLVLHVNHDDTYAKQVAVISRSKPDLKLGDVYLVNTAGLNRVVKITNQLKSIRAGRVLTRINQLFSVAN